MMPVEHDSEDDYNNDDINNSVKQVALCLFRKHCMEGVLDGENFKNNENLTIIMIVGLMHDYTDENEVWGMAKLMTAMPNNDYNDYSASLSGLWAVLVCVLKEELPERFAVGRLEDPCIHVYMILFWCKNRFLAKRFHISCLEAGGPKVLS